MPKIFGKALGEYGQIKVHPRNHKGHRYICSSESFEGVRVEMLRSQTLGHRCGGEGQLPLTGPRDRECWSPLALQQRRAAFFPGPLPSRRAALQQSPPCPLSPPASPPASVRRGLLNLPSGSVGTVLLIMTTTGGVGGDAWRGEGHAHPSCQGTRAPATSLSAWDASSPRHPSPSQPQS